MFVVYSFYSFIFLLVVWSFSLKQPFLRGVNEPLGTISIWWQWHRILYPQKWVALLAMFLFTDDKKKWQKHIVVVECEWTLNIWHHDVIKLESTEAVTMPDCFIWFALLPCNLYVDSCKKWWWIKSTSYHISALREMTGIRAWSVRRAKN